jgi:polyisoprenoid-binding protein YceI
MKISLSRRILASTITLGAFVGSAGIAVASSGSTETDRAAATSAAKSDYVVDAVHSAVIFRIKHLEASYSYGRFNKFEGVVNYDPTEGLSAIKINLDVDSVDTANAARDEHLRSPDFFNTKQFPKATFKSASVTKTGDHTYDVTGEFTLAGVTKTVTVSVEHVGNGKSMQGGDVAGFETTFNFKRSEYGITKYLPTGIGDDVRLTVSLEAGKQ